MKFLALHCVLFGLCGSLFAQSVALKSRYEISQGGTTRQLTIRTDEVAVKRPDGRRVIEKVPAGDLRGEAKKRRAKAAATTEIELILTDEKGALKHFVTRQVLVKLQKGADAKAISKRSGLRIASTPSYAPGFVIFDALTSEAALDAMESLRTQPGIESADVLLATQKAKKFTPNDSLFSEQWHLRNTTQLGGALWVDTNILTAWDSFKGTGITIGILDDGVEHAHPDIQPNYNPAIDYDYNSNDNDPTPVDLAADSHGTACAGVAAARGNNGIGVTGAAPEATLTGFRLIAAANTDQNEADAFAAHNDAIHIKSNSWGWPDGGGYGGPGPLAAAALEAGITSGRGGKGVIYVFAGGNGLTDGDNSNMDGYAVSPYVIAVGAVNDFGFQSYYGEKGANLLISAPSSGGGHNEGIRTTDLVGENGDNKSSVGTGDLADRSYTNGFGGTSSACPLVSGVVALILQANPNLSWRDVQEILIRTARKNHRTDSDWSTNAAGLTFNHKYGSGIIDAAAAVALAQQWTNLPAMTTAQVAQTGIAVAITDNNSTGVTRTLNFSSANFRVEHVTVTVNATHTARGDLEVTLTSPSGMVSRLMEAFSDGSDNLAWTFSSVRHWGESAAGNWTVKVADRVVGDVGTLTGVTVKLWGSSNTGARIAGASSSLTAEGNTPANTAADPGESVSFSLGLKNIGAAATSNLTATLQPIGGVSDVSAAQNYGALTAGGATVTRAFSFKLAGGCGTSVPLLLKLQDGATDLGFTSLVIPLGTSASTTFTGGAITINDNTVATPSPSNLNVTGLVGRVQGLTAQLNSLTHNYVDDVGALLHGPDALKLRLFCGGTSNPMSLVNLTFDDNASIIFPYDGPVPSGSYKPWDFYGAYHATYNPSGRNFTGDTSVEAAFTIGEYLGLSANGTWKLYLQDFVAGVAGSLSNWKLNFTTVTCTDNIFLTQASASGYEDAGSIAVSVTRTGGKEGNATINYTTSNGTATAGSDYTATSGSLTFAAGELTKTFSIPITNDTAQEASETINLNLSTAGGNATLGTLATGTLTILANDDPTPVTISPATQTVNEGDATLTFTVSRATLGNAGTVAYAASSGTATSGSDFTTASGTLSFAASDLSKTFTVALLNDSVLESNESFTLALSAPSGGLLLGTTATATVNIVDGDSDSDGMADDYESGVGLNPLANDAALDLDGDGTSNINEFILGSLPNSGSSLFQVTAEIGAVNIGVKFPTLPGRIYKVERSDTLISPWNVVQESIAGTGAVITITDPGAVSQSKRFYRVTVTLP